jgi:chaperonin GroES
VSVILSLRKSLLDATSSFARDARGQDIVTGAEQSFKNGFDLGGTFVLAKNHLREAAAQGAMMIDPGEFDILERQTLELLDSRGNFGLSGGNGIEEFADRVSVHMILYVRSLVEARSWIIASFLASRPEVYERSPVAKTDPKATIETVEPLGKRVLIRKDEDKKTTKGGIELPGNIEIPTLTGRVVAVSAQIDRDEDYPIRQYDKVLFNPKNTVPVDFEGDNRLFVVPVEDVVAVFRREVE